MQCERVLIISEESRIIRSLREKSKFLAEFARLIKRSKALVFRVLQPKKICRSTLRPGRPKRKQPFSSVVYWHAKWGPILFLLFKMLKVLTNVSLSTTMRGRL